MPVPALLLTTILSQLFLVVTYFSDDAFNFALDLTSALTLIPFLLAAAYALKLVLNHDATNARRDLVVGVLATIYTAFLLYAAGPKFILVSLVIYAPATALFIIARKEQGRAVFSQRELVIFAVSIVGAVIGIISLAAGWIGI